MNRFTIATLTLLILASQAQASITVTFSGNENVLVKSFYYMEGVDTTCQGVYSDSVGSGTISETLDITGGAYAFFFEVWAKTDFDTTKDIAGFIAEISGTSGGSSISLLSSTKWGCSTDLDDTPSADHDFLYLSSLIFSWENAVSYDAAIGDSPSGISSSADWIWASGHGTSIAGFEHLWVVTTVLVPEPTSIIVWSLVGVCMVFGVRFGRRAKRA
jgi:hypothetical protein